MVKQIPCYACEKCGRYAIGEEGRVEIAQHERTPITGKNDSLDGLIVRLGGKGKDVYSVFRQLEVVDPKHKVLYAWKNYFRNNLDEEHARDTPTEKKVNIMLQKLVDKLDPRRGFTAEQIIGGTLHTSHSENSYLDYTELSPPEFNRVVKVLRARYPELYAKTEFKRTPKYRGKKVR